MKKLIMLILLLYTSIFAQPHIKWGRDPVNPGYKGDPGMILVKTLYDPLVETGGGSGRWVTGFAGENRLFWIDSLIFFSKNPILEGIADTCGNPTKFLNGGIDRRRIKTFLSPQIKKRVPGGVTSTRVIFNMTPSKTISPNCGEIALRNTISSLGGMMGYYKVARVPIGVRRFYYCPMRRRCR